MTQSNSKLKKYPVEHGEDGWNRITISVYESLRDPEMIAKEVSKQLRQKWVSFGCFMDTACIATKGKVGDYVLLALSGKGE